MSTLDAIAAIDVAEGYAAAVLRRCLKADAIKDHVMRALAEDAIADLDTARAALQRPDDVVI